MWTVLCFGWCSSPFIYHSLSDAVAQHIRSRGVLIITWLDDIWLTNRRAPNEQMHNLVRERVWLQVHVDFTLKLRWISSGENSGVDRMTRPDT